MQRISAQGLKAGMVVASNIYSADGRLLATSGTTLNPTAIYKLKKMGVGSVYVQNPLFANLEIPELVTEDTRVKAMLALQAAVAKYRKTQELDLEGLKGPVRTLVSEIILNRDSMIHLTDMRTHDDYIFGHSVNVCLLAVMIALGMDYNETKLSDFAMGALLHDIGMVSIPEEILLKVGNLTPEESAIVQRHAEIGFGVVRKLRDLSTPAAHIAYQHHERMDGKGYPRQLKADDIHEFARITLVADVFDALIADRPYRSGFLPHEAYEILMTLADSYLDRNILELFLNNVAPYPIGTTVKLESGAHAIVTGVLPKLQSRPTVRLITDKNGNPLQEPEEINLAEHLTEFIAKVLKEREVFALSKEVTKAVKPPPESPSAGE
jgi:HD-GYP domain-containing protein (c-di-GMP phosphodiesterase class II)